MLARFGLGILARPAVVAFLAGLTLAGGLYGLHRWDKARAIKAATEGLVTAFDLAAAEAERDALATRLARAQESGRIFDERAQAAAGRALKLANEIEAFRNETEINPSCRVDPDFARRLRAD